MTVASTTTRIKYNCSGGTTYTFAFGVDVSSEIKVILEDGAGTQTTLTETTHYTVSATNNDFSSGGTVTTVASYDTPNTITILLNVPLSQDSDFIEGMGNLYETFEDGLDKLTRIALQSKEISDRALTLPESSAASASLPPLVAEGYLRGNSDASGIECVALVDSGSISDEAYDATTWLAADDTAPSKKAVRNVLEAMQDDIDGKVDAVYASAAEIITGTEDAKPIAPDQLKASYLCVPTGIVLPYGKSTAPDGWLICNGAAYSRETYADLYDVIGTTFGVGNGSTTFNVPDLRDKVAVGSGSTYALAATGGAATHTLTVAEMPSHRHSETGWAQVSGYTGAGTGNVCGTYTGYEGGGQAHNNMQPYVSLNYIIKY